MQVQLGRSFYNVLMGFFLLLALSSQVMANQATYQETDWDALMPPDYTLDGFFTEEELNALDDLDPKAAELMDRLQEALNSAPIVPEMDGKEVKIPGFVVPIEGENQTIYSFFLVPYFGACIHTPPPPSNQIIMVNYEPGVKIDSLYDAVWVSGKLTTKTFANDLATSGYALEAMRIEPYDE
jgi:hypothetical protein